MVGGDVAISYEENSNLTSTPKLILEIISWLTIVVDCLRLPLSITLHGIELNLFAYYQTLSECLH
jgi:formylmethanofuran dehydrogenase subunit A